MRENADDAYEQMVGNKTYNGNAGQCSDWIERLMNGRRPTPIATSRSEIVIQSPWSDGTARSAKPRISSPRRPFFLAAECV
jgi:hypothetical protein